MAIENVVKLLEIISVAPAFLRGYFEKWRYITTANTRQNFVLQRELYFNITDPHLTGASITPAGFYTGIWCRDASFILTDLLEVGRIETVAAWIERVWQNQIGHAPRVVHGRGSPEMGFRLRRLDGDDTKTFSGALPSSIQYGYSEIYGKSPDIDSTALMISATCLFCMSTGKLVEKLVPKLREAVSALARKDVDNDGLLEQGPNEDWMDTMLRSGKVVYSQGVWASALLNWSKLLSKLGYSQESESAHKAYKTVLSQVNSKLWSEKQLCYVDLPDQSNSQPVDKGWHSKTRITQDVSSFLLAEEIGTSRAISTLDTLAKTLWTNLGPTCVSPPSNETGPRHFGPNKYQNGGIWPWITSSEILARIRHVQDASSNVLLNAILPYSYLEWLNPVGSGSGSYPFRTGIAAIRSAIRYLNNKNAATNRSN